MWHLVFTVHYIEVKFYYYSLSVTCSHHQENIHNVWSSIETVMISNAITLLNFGLQSILNQVRSRHHKIKELLEIGWCLFQMFWLTTQFNPTFLPSTISQSVSHKYLFEVFSIPHRYPFFMFFQIVRLSQFFGDLEQPTHKLCQFIGWNAVLLVATSLFTGGNLLFFVLALLWSFLVLFCM